MIIYVFFRLNNLFLKVGNYLSEDDINILILFTVVQIALNLMVLVNIIFHVKISIN